MSTSQSMSCKSGSGHEKAGSCKFLITGASEGIGHQVACGLVKKGMHVIMTARDESTGCAAKKELENCEQYREEMKNRICVMELDVLKDDSIIKCADRLKSEGCQLEGLICNAAVATRSTPVTIQSARQVINVNYYGYWKTFEYFRSRDLLTKGCKVIFVSSNMGVLSLEGSSKELLERLFDPNMTVEELNSIAEDFVSCVEKGEDAVKKAGYAVFEHTETQWDYAFSKALILILTRILAKKYEGTYYINTIHPGYVQTAMTHHTKEAPHKPHEGAHPIVELAANPPKVTGHYFDRSECKCNLLTCTPHDILSKRGQSQGGMMHSAKETIKEGKESVKEAFGKMTGSSSSSHEPQHTAGKRE